MKKRIAFFFVLGLGLIYGCRKELSYESSGILSVGSLQSDVSGDCLPKIVSGIYEAGTVLVGTANLIKIEVNVSTIGSYIIHTDTVNGYYFKATGVFSDTGTFQVTMKGAGTPLVSGIDNFTVHYGSQTCSIDITVLQAGSGGPAVGTLGGGPGQCAPFTPNGIYAVGMALTFSHNVQVQLNVTSGGSYSITTDTLAGFWFSAIGNVAVGNSLITLNGNGTPSSGGNKTFTVKFGSIICTFTITVGSIATLNDYFPRTTNSNWSYEFDDVATDSFLNYVIAPTIPALGNTYNIIMEKDITGTDTSDLYDYTRKSAGNYSHFTNLANYLGFDNDQWNEFIFLKDDQPAGYIWYSPAFSGDTSGVAITIHIKFTILQKDVPISVISSMGTVTYQNTIVVEERYESQSGPSWTPMDARYGYFKDYYSRNIGWILDEYYDSSNTLQNKIELRRYVVY